jgi:hypothetical protein
MYPDKAPGHLHSENMMDRVGDIGPYACWTWRWRLGISYRKRWPGARVGSGATSVVSRREAVECKVTRVQEAAADDAA